MENELATQIARLPMTLDRVITRSPLPQRRRKLQGTVSDIGIRAEVNIIMHTPQEKQKGLAREAQSIVSKGLPATPLSRQDDNIANPDGHVWLRMASRQKSANVFIRGCDRIGGSAPAVTLL